MVMLSGTTANERQGFQATCPAHTPALPNCRPQGFGVFHGRGLARGPGEGAAAAAMAGSHVGLAPLVVQGMACVPLMRCMCGIQSDASGGQFEGARLTKHCVFLPVFSLPPGHRRSDRQAARRADSAAAGIAGGGGAGHGSVWSGAGC